MVGRLLLALAQTSATLRVFGAIQGCRSLSPIPSMPEVVVTGAPIASLELLKLQTSGQTLHVAFHDLFIQAS